MPRCRLAAGWLALTVVGSISGCGWWSSDDASSPDESLPEISFAEPEEEPPASEAKAVEQARFRVGQRFPFQQRVEHTLTQSGGGATTTSRSTLELVFHLTVEQVDGAKTRWGVQFEQVRYGHDVAGRRVEYDSSARLASVPPEAAAYHGLAGNGFSVWVGTQPGELDFTGMDEFLDRAAEKVPAAERAALRQHLSAVWEAGGLKSFIEETLQIVPAEVDLKQVASLDAAKRSWSREQRLTQPVAMKLGTTYSLTSFDEHTAQIEVSGTVEPASTIVPASAQDATFHTTVRGGQCAGRSTIDLETGLPVWSETKREIDMLLGTPDGQQIEQRKQVLTTTRAFPLHVAQAAGRRTEAASSPKPTRFRLSTPR